MRPIVRALAAAMLVGFALPGAAQPVRPSVARTGWLPRRVELNALTPAQRAAAIATLDKIERLIRQVPELADPDGFEIQPVIGGGARPLGPDDRPIPNSLVEYGISFMMFSPSREIAGEGCGCIRVRVNPHELGGAAPLKDAQGRLIFIEEARAMRPIGTPEEVAGTLWEVPSATQVYGELWDFSRDIREGRGERSGLSAIFIGAGELPWKPVSREAFYAASRLEREGKDGTAGARVREVLSKTAYERWLEEAPERNRARQETLDAARQTLPPSRIAELRKQLEDTDRQVGEQLRLSDAAERERNRASLAANDSLQDAFARELVAMTPDERRMPAYVDNALSEGPIATGWRLTTDSSPPAWRVLTPNYEFWRARRSPTEVRSIRVQIAITGTGLQPKVRRALLQAFRSLDWPAFNRLLDSPP